MLVRLVTELRRRGRLLEPGSVIEVRDREALVLLQDGAAVPVEPAEFARETR